MTSSQDKDTSSQAELLEQTRALVESVVMRRVDADTALIESGLVDSVLAVEIVLHVETVFGVRLPPTEIAEHLASVATLAEYIADNTANR
ncbi:acyl carrier protein [Trinickia dinghuensis]|uniref:Acyl carrier protein n=1 Tax=Trinickia dinghuensis TaxID=2291023 RepID=A0A3D8JZZ7_9BURK|nr:acyl carrier protein [Trinickia dinghuensis]RDU98412.1 acyl carrier protein [Trinickia dinghuensis]